MDRHGLTNMTQTTFQNKWFGRYLNYDGVYGSQCVDLMRGFVKEVYDLNPYVAIPTTGDAKDIYTNFKNNQYFVKVPNTPTGVPQRGDIVFFKTSLWYPWLYGRAGHVGVVESANVMSLVLFNQNYPTNSPCLFRKFTYKDCLGWLHKI